MALSAKQKQKKTERKKQKRKMAKPLTRLSQQGPSAHSYARYPLHECLVPPDLFDNGIGVIVISRSLPDDAIAAAVFLVDTYCLGVKNAYFTLLDREYYDGGFKEELYDGYADGEFQRTHPSCAMKIIEGAKAYAAEYGFQPHKDYHKAIPLLKGIDPAACPVKYDFGHKGKPFYIQGPHESDSDTRRIMKRIQTHKS
ncbi:MAG: hypothetical protein HQL48_11375 [Gammaproteobacteria bacterium]|nr:hypothetical protein [Gammaproteobacteria bacterium]